MYAIVKNNKIVKYPCDPIKENPGTSFPEDFFSNWVDVKIGDNSYVKVEANPPTDVKFGYTPVEGEPIYDKVTKKYYQNFTVEMLSPEILKNIIANLRYYHEVSGVIIDGNKFQTDRNSQVKYSMLAMRNETINWKNSEGKFIEINAKNVYEVVDKHVKACFAKEKEYCDILDTNNKKTIEGTDFKSGWPGQEIIKEE
jgi:hypothetical protein